MKFIRHLLSHGLLLTFIIALGAAYFYRAVIFSEEVNTKINGVVNTALVALTLEPMQSDLLIEEDPTVPVCDSPTETVVDIIVSDAEVVDVNSEVVTDDVEVALTTVEDITETKIEEVNVETVEKIVDTATEDASDSNEPTEQEAVVEETVEGKVEDIVAEVVIDDAPSVIEPVTQDVATKDESADAKSVMENIPVDPHFELLNQARFAHQIGNNFNAIELYRELIQSYPDDPNVYGELGNVYYSKGKWKQASQAYYEAAVRLHKIEKTEQISYLVRVIDGLDPETAKKLNEQLGR